ncbi:LpqN/LpqT family lipoprotein [Mycolicibacterium thermoresistibile]
MGTTARHRAFAAAALAVGLALTACGSSTEDQVPTAAPDTAEAAPTSATPAAMPNYTIVDYIRDNNIPETPVRPGDPGSPAVDLPIPPGWSDAADRAPEWAWGAIVYADPAVADDPPSIIALMSRLSGNVDAAKILEFAPAELKNLPGFDGSDATPNTLSGYAAVQIGGRYEKDGIRRLVAQKTVVIPVPDALFVLQLNADGPAEQADALTAATAVIDEQTKITI